MSEDHRAHIRVHLNCRVFIELAAAIGGEPAEIAQCKTLDVSFGGVKVSLGRELVVGSLLQVGVELPGVDNALYLTGEVKWCRPHDDPDAPWAAGFQFLNSEASDIDKWRELLEHV